jgi:hypothetical protein
MLCSLSPLPGEGRGEGLLLALTPVSSDSRGFFYNGGVLIAEPTNPDLLLTVVREWLRLLAMNKWDEASGMLDEPNCYGIRWTPQYIRYALDLTFGPSSRFRTAHPEGPQFTDPDSAGGTLHGDVVAFDDGRGFSANHDVPLNGAWSELTAQFEFLRRPGGLAVVLHDMHVM